MQKRAVCGCFRPPRPRPQAKRPSRSAGAVRAGPSGPHGRLVLCGIWDMIVEKHICALCGPQWATGAASVPAYSKRLCVRNCRPEPVQSVFKVGYGFYLMESGRNGSVSNHLEPNLETSLRKRYAGGMPVALSAALAPARQLPLAHAHAPCVTHRCTGKFLTIHTECTGNFLKISARCARRQILNQIWRNMWQGQVEMLTTSRQRVSG